MRKVDFIIPGAQKCGTMALRAFLKAHPKIRMSTDTEPHFFDDDVLDWSNPDYRSYHAQFEGLESSASDIVFGEKTPRYLFWPNAMERIHAYNPAIRLVILLRHPADRAYSHWKMSSERRRETLSFSEAIREGRERFLREDGSYRPTGPFSYLERGFYSEQLDRVFNLFPKEQVMLVRQQALRHTHEITLNRIARFIGAGPFPTTPEPAIVHARQGTMTSEDRDYLEEYYSNELRTLRTRFGIAL